MSLVRQIRRGLELRRRTEADIAFSIYVRPHGSDGLHVVRRECNETEIVVGSSLAGLTFPPGAVPPLGSHTGTPGEFILGAPPPGRRGSSRFAQDFPTPGDLEAVGIIAASPATVPAGASGEAVTLSGFGFRAADTFEAVVLDPLTGAWGLDSLVTVATVAVTDAETASVTLTVAAGAPVGHEVSFRVVGMSAVGDDLMRVVAEAVDPCGAGLTGRSYYGVYFDQPNNMLYVWDYVDGAFQGVVDSMAYNPFGTHADEPLHSILLNGGALEFKDDPGPVYVWTPGSPPTTHATFADPLADFSDSSWNGSFSGVQVGLRRIIGASGTYLFGSTEIGGNFYRGGYDPTHSFTPGDFLPYVGSSRGSGHQPSGGYLLCEGRKQSDSTPALFRLDVGALNWEVFHPYNLVGVLSTDTSPTKMSSGVDLGDGRAAFARREGTAWTVVFRAENGSGDVQHWPFGWGLQTQSGVPPKIRLPPTGNDLVVYPFDGWLACRTDRRVSEIDGSCSAPTFEVAAGPLGRPQLLLPRD